MNAVSLDEIIQAAIAVDNHDKQCKKMFIQLKGKAIDKSSERVLKTLQERLIEKVLIYANQTKAF